MPDLASVRVALEYSGACTFTPDIVVEQVRADSGAGLPESVDVDLDYDTELWDAITAPVRWTRPRLVFEGNDVILGRSGQIQMSRSLGGEMQTVEYGTIGPLWAMPTIEPELRESDPCPPISTSGASGRTPFAWGNKTVELYLGFSQGNGILKEVKVFQGLTFQKSSRRDTGIGGSFSAVDESLRYAKLPICYQLPPFAGKRRGEIFKDLAAAVGIDPAQVIVPVGKEVTKPLLLSNEHLLPFLTAFGQPENWFSRFDEFGRLVVEEIELKSDPDWTFDAARGDFEADTFEETLPSGPPTRYYITATQPVKGTGPGGSDLDRTSKTTESIEELYAPRTDKVRPSAQPSYLYADGSYRSLAAQALMLVSRRTSFATTHNGVPVRSRVVQEGFYNPAAVDPNFNASPVTNSYDAAYGNKTFHRDEVEPFIVFEEATLDGSFDQFGTLQRQVQSTRGWYSPQHALLHAGSPQSDLKNFPGAAYVYPGGIMRRDPVEQFLETKRVETEYTYGPDGALLETLETTSGWFSPKSRADIVAVVVNPDVPPIPILDSPPLPNPPPPAPPPPVIGPPPPPTRTVWAPRLLGPTRRYRNNFYFDLDVSAMPRLTGGATASFVGNFYLTGSASLGAHVPAQIVFTETRALGGGLYSFRQRLNAGALTVPSPSIIQNAFMATVNQTTSTDPLVKPADLEGAFAYGVVTITGGVDAGTYQTPFLYFDPWANADPAGLMVR
jgi:hypothetical protein